MNSAALKLLVPQAALLAGIIAAGLTAGMPAPLTAVFSCLAAVFASVEMLWLTRPKSAGRWGLPVAWAGTLAGMIGVLDTAYFWSSRFVVPMFLLAMSAGLVGQRLLDVTVRNRWRGLALTWAFPGGIILLAVSYAGNERAAFYTGLPVNLALLVLCKRWFRLGALGVQTVNTLILLLVGLPLASPLIYGAGTLRRPIDPTKKYYSYETWTRSPAKYEAWWAYYGSEWGKVAKAIQTRDRLPAGLPFRLIPNSHAVLVQCPISINSQGFRGTNIPAEKGSTFRIVALGESTTFGLTCTAGGRPWPELLEAMIRDRLKLRRPVEVINAGTASYDIEHNLVRLPLDILPLKPDLIISYHGINGFRLVDSSLPTQFGPAPPDYRRRPVELLAMAEFKVRTMLYNRRFVAELPATSALTTNVMESRYALDYRKLIGLARTNGIRLVLANYSMAVNGQSDPKVTGFYAKATPPVVWDIHANEAHSRLVAALARENPGVTFVDTHPRLDGRRDNFIDLVHFSEEGEQAMAETMFAGIRKILEEELSPAAASPDRP